MRTSRAWAWFIAALAAATVQALSAQGMCSALTDSIETCWHKYVPDDQEAAVQRAERRARTGADIANSVLDLVTSTSVVGADTASTVSNFLPLLALTGFGGDLGGTTEDAATNDQDLAFDVNLPFFGSNGDNALKVQAAFARDRQIHEPLLNAIPEADRDRVKTQFENDSTIGDDARFTVSYNLVNDRFGRSFRRHRARFESLYDAATSDQRPAALTPALIAARRLAGGFGLDVTELAQNTPIRDWPADASGLTEEARAQLPEIRNAIMALVEQAALSTQTADAAANAQLATFRLLEFRDLIDNQPQLMFSATTRQRDDLIGPDETTASFTFEFPFGANLTGFAREFGANRCSEWGSSDCLEAFRDYVANQSEMSALSPRFSVSIEYVDVDDYRVSLADPVVTFAQTGARKLVASAGMGLRFRGDGFAADTRFDFALKREDVSDDPTRNNRTVATATWTKQFAGMSIPVTLIYSNKPEFLDQQALGERFSVNVGLKYEIRQPERE